MKGRDFWSGEIKCHLSTIFALSTLCTLFSREVWEENERVARVFAGNYNQRYMLHRMYRWYIIGDSRAYIATAGASSKRRLLFFFHTHRWIKERMKGRHNAVCACNVSSVCSLTFFSLSFTWTNDRVDISLAEASKLSYKYMHMYMYMCILSIDNSDDPHECLYVQGKVLGLSPCYLSRVRLLVCFSSPFCWNWTV